MTDLQTQPAAPQSDTDIARAILEASLRMSRRSTDAERDSIAEAFAGMILHSSQPDDMGAAS